MMLPVLELPVGLSGMCGSMHVFPTGILSRCHQPSRLCLQSVTKLHQAEVIPSPAPLLNRTCYTGEGTEAATAPIPFTAQLEQPPTECSEGRAPARAVLGTGKRTGRALCCPPARSLRSQDTPHLSLPDRNTQTRLWLQHRLSKCRNNLRQAVQTEQNAALGSSLPALPGDTASRRAGGMSPLRAQTAESPQRHRSGLGRAAGRG